MSPNADETISRLITSLKFDLARVSRATDYFCRVQFEKEDQYVSLLYDGRKVSFNSDKIDLGVGSRDYIFKLGTPLFEAVENFLVRNLYKSFWSCQEKVAYLVPENKVKNYLFELCNDVSRWILKGSNSDEGGGGFYEHLPTGYKLYVSNLYESNFLDYIDCVLLDNYCQLIFFEGISFSVRERLQLRDMFKKIRVFAARRKKNNNALS